MERFALHEARGRRVLARRRDQRVHRGIRAVDAREGSGAGRRLTQVLFDAAEAVRLAAVLLLPVMPASAAEILRRVGEPTRRRR